MIPYGKKLYAFGGESQKRNQKSNPLKRSTFRLIMAALGRKLQRKNIFPHTLLNDMMPISTAVSHAAQIIPKETILSGLYGKMGK